MGRRGIAIPTLAAALSALDEWKISAELPDTKDGYAINYKIEYIWIDPDGCERECAKEELEQRGSGDSEIPRPGQYEIRIIDLKDNNLLIAWQAEHVNSRSMMRSPAESPMALMKEMCYTAETQIRNTQFRLEKAEKDAEKARDSLHSVRENLAKLQRELAAAVTAKERALADKDLAEARQQELQQAVDQMEEDLSLWKPQVQMAVDHGMGRLSEMLFGMSPRNSNAPEESQEGWDPPPADLLQPDVIDQGIFSLFFDLEKLQAMVENGMFSWQFARSVLWHKTKRDPGPVPQWDQWRAERDASEPMAAE